MVSLDRRDHLPARATTKAPGLMRRLYSQPDSSSQSRSSCLKLSSLLATLGVLAVQQETSSPYGTHREARRQAVLTITSRTRRVCDGATRRKLLQAGGAG